MSERTLFDEPEEPSEAEASEWEEIPQDRFLSWPYAMQMQYCASRDLDAAEHALSNYWMEFFLNRAKAYREA